MSSIPDLTHLTHPSTVLASWGEGGGGVVSIVYVVSCRVAVLFFIYYVQIFINSR